MAHIDYYFSVLSPYCYLAGTRLEEIAARHGASITYKPFDLLALMARLGAQAPNERPPARMAYRAQDLKRVANKLQMPFTLNPQGAPTNPAPASYALIAAQEEGGGDLGALAHGLMRAIWEEERNIAEDPVIEDCLDAAGFSRGLAFSGMIKGAEIYARNLEDAHAAGVIGAPFYITEDDQRFWGQDRLEMLDAHLGGTL